MFTPILAGQAFPHTIGKFVCVGRNYAEHAKELNNPIPSKPLLFMKPADAAAPLAPQFGIPLQYGSVHHELEITILIGKKLHRASQDEAQAAIAGVGIGLDLTLRDVQDGLKSKGQPWEIAKAFDGSCPVSAFVAPSDFADLQQIDIALLRNDKVQQQGNSRDMLFAIVPLIAQMSDLFTLNPGDVIMTGTPAGVGELLVGDQLELKLGNMLSVSAQVVAA
ncbi:MAG: hypothetical protein RL217_408 [Pseudomonadota bacterium]|jgi:2-keto-4-pentenoate hydratase/2-oxohepta-3-ene-1,7-dioic acid hydratase in catechol pathway